MNRSRIWMVLALFLLSLLLSPGEKASASPRPEDQSILFILDASGSMWGRVEGRTKIEIARDVLQEMLLGLPEDQPAGLMAYGHRRKGDCADIEALIPVGAGQNAALAKTVRKLQPKGMTPISDALVSAAESLKYKENAASIVLVSDGVETCKGDPCAVAKSLHQAGVDLKVYVVGFDVSGLEEQDLQCIADVGGGRFFTAGGARDLTEALAAIQAHVALREPLPEPTPEPVQIAPEAPRVDAQAAGTTRIKLGSVATIQLQLASWVRMPPRYWKILDAESGTEVGVGQGDSVRITPGTYQFLWRQTEHAAEDVFLNTTVVAESGQTTPVPLDTGIRLTGPQGLGNAYYWQLKDDAGQVVAQFRNKETYLPQLVPAGRYRLVWRLTQHDTTEADLGEVEIATGQLLDKVLDTGFVLALPEWLGQPYEAVLEEKGGGSYTFKLTGAHPFKPGEYTLVWRQTQHKHSSAVLGPVVIQPGGYATLPVNAGLTFLAQGQKPPYRIIATNLATGEKAELKETWGPMPLQPGIYALDMQEKQHGASPIRLVDELSIEAGQLLELEM